MFLQLAFISPINVKNIHQVKPYSPYLCRLLLLLLLYPIASLSSDKLVSYSELRDAGVLLQDKHGLPVIALHAKRTAIPASTTKLITAWLALTHWGEDYRFKTRFFLDKKNATLWIKGSGDPFLVSEEMLLMAKQLFKLGINKINTIGLDVSLFQPNLTVPGGSLSNNPYDAVPTAIAANFNTVALKKTAGKIVSAEPQTPLTPYAKSLTHQLSGLKSADEIRINTGPNSADAERYFAELLAAFLRQQGVTVGKKVIWGKAPDIDLYYSHVNSKNLGQIIRPMMKYSTNFIANQLVLMLSAEHKLSQANFADVQHYMEQRLARQFKWTDFTLKEGAGLSRENQLSPQQLVQLLEAFRPWKHLLPEVTSGIYAKSGTLNKVSTLAGYAVDGEQQWQAFALMMNQTVRQRRRNQIARELVSR